MEKQLSAVMTIEQDFIDEIVVSPQGIDIVHVEFNVVRSAVGNGMTMTEVDVATTVYHLNMRIKNGDVIIIFGVSLNTKQLSFKDQLTCFFHINGSL